ncbi:MAG: radical SAM protein [Elusimicrobia bacterium]|nr:radical SAM protein [Elusimicrobiota bacterium]
MTQPRGASVGDYRAPLFVAWQLTNACSGRCPHCCEDSGPRRAWPDELSRPAALAVAEGIAAAGVPYVAFGGGEPTSAPHFWELCEVLSRGGTNLKLETDGRRLDADAVERLKGWNAACVQVSLDGATAEAHERLRPRGSFAEGLAALRRLAAAGLGPEWVFAPTRLNLHEAGAAFDLAAASGARTFVSGPLMRLGRAAADWGRLAPSDEEWRRCAEALAERAARPGAPRLSLYPWDIVAEVRARRASPQAMILIVPNGQVKLLNALPFAPADLRRQSLGEAWTAARSAWKSPEVSDFIGRLLADPSLLRHANECWPLREAP